MSNYNLIIPNREVYISSPNGRSPLVGTFGEFYATGLKPQIEVMFNYDIPDVADYGTTTGTGVLTHSDNLLIANSGTGTSGLADYCSKEHLQYHTGHTVVVFFTAAFTTPEATADQLIGAFDDEDGVYIGYKGTQFVCGYRHSGVDYDYPINSFPAGTDLTKMNIFHISFGYLGVAPIFFAMKRRASDELVPLYTIAINGTTTTTHIGNPILPMCVRVEKTSGTTNEIKIITASWLAGIMGDHNDVSGRNFTVKGSGTLSGTNKLTLGNFHNKTTFNSRTNKIKAVLVSYQFFVDIPASGTGTVEFELRRNATLTGTPAYSDVDTTNSIIELDSALSYSSGGSLMLPEWIAYSSQGSGKSASNFGPASALLRNLFLYPDEVATLTAQNVYGSTNVTVRYSFTWTELF